MISASILTIINKRQSQPQDLQVRGRQWQPPSVPMTMRAVTVQIQALKLEM